MRRIVARSNGFVQRRFFFSGARPVYELVRDEFERGNLEQAHSLVTEAVKEELQRMEEGSTVSRWDLPLLALELGKSFLKNSESREAMLALEHSVSLFEDAFAEKTGVDNDVVHARYTETLLHLAKLQYLCGDSSCEGLWKKTIAHTMKHMGRNSYEVLVATNGLAEFYLEQLRLSEAERFASAAAELAREMKRELESQKKDTEFRKVHERQIEAITMQGLARVQQQDYQRGFKYYEEAMSEMVDLELRADGVMDDFMRVAFFNLSRNMEHALKGLGRDEDAVEVKKKMEQKLGRFEEVELHQQDVEETTKNKD